MKPVILFIIISLLFINCGSPRPVISSAKIQITVSILPQKYFVHRIVGGDNLDFDIHIMIPPGHSPATYAPTPQQMKGLSHSKLYFRIGHIPFEKAWMKNIAANNPHLKIIDTSVGVDLIETGESEDDVHQDHHHHAGIDPHIWLSPHAVKIQAKHILDAVIELDSQHRELYEENYRLFLRDIDGLDREIKAVLEQYRGKKFMVFHPAWSYFARDYSLEQLPIEVEGKAPNPANLKKIIDIARQENIRIIFVQEQFDTNSARAVAAEIGGQVVKIDPLALDWLDNMKGIAQTLSDALK